MEQQQEELTTKELALMQILGDENHNQRSIARSSGFSLGMTNLLLKRLVNKGYVKVVTLNGRTLKYILTPRGFSEKLRRSYDYVITSIRRLSELRRQIQKVVEEHLTVVDGAYYEQVYILGRSELAELARETLKEKQVRLVSVHSTDDISVSALNPPEPTTIILQCDMNNISDEAIEDLSGVKVIELSKLIQF